MEGKRTGGGVSTGKLMVASKIHVCVYGEGFFFEGVASATW